MFEVSAIALMHFLVQWQGDGSAGVDGSVKGLSLHNLGDAIVIAMIFVKGDFVPDPEADEQSNGHAYCQSGYIDNSVRAVSAEGTPGGPEIAFDHMNDFICPEWF